MKKEKEMIKLDWIYRMFPKRRPQRRLVSGLPQPDVQSRLIQATRPRYDEVRCPEFRRNSGGRMFLTTPQLEVIKQERRQIMVAR